VEIPTYREEPFPWYREMRQKNPILYDSGSAYIFTYDLTKQVLEDFKNYSSQFRDFIEPEIAETLNQHSAPSILILDPPRHTKLRNLVSRAFTPSKVSSYENEIRRIAEALAGKMEAQKTAEMVSAFSYPLPVLVISRILGVPEEDMHLFKDWSDRIATSLGRGVDVTTQLEMAKYFSSLIEDRKKRPADDLISGLLEAEVDGDKLTLQEIVGFCILLLVAGNETTTNLITNSLLTLHEYGLLDEIRDHPSLIPGAVEETLRFRSPVQSTRRIAKTDMEIAGIRIPKHTLLFVYLGSANRDESVFPDSEKFIITRSQNRHLAFGEGVHFCLGAPLARLEARIALETICRMFETIVIRQPSADDRLDSDIMYGFKRLEAVIR